MHFIRVQPEDHASVTADAELLEAARAVDDPESYPFVAELLARELRFGSDLEPSEHYLCMLDDSPLPVAVIEITLPLRDNLHLMTTTVTVHPRHRGVGHGTRAIQWVVERARSEGRDTIWTWAPVDEPTIGAFLIARGFAPASRDARRRQRLADVDRDELERQWDAARAASADYAIERHRIPVSDDLLAELVEVTAAINDAPMGDLTFEDEKFDVQRVRDLETAAAGRGDVGYRVLARHRGTGDVGGHTVVFCNPLRPGFGSQWDTAVAKAHRGHRLGTLLKIDMMHWLEEAEPELEVIETWNNADNAFMIRVNEAIGYRLSRIYATYQLTLRSDRSAG